MSDNSILDKRIQRSTAALKDSLIKLLRVKPFESISVSDIINTAGYSRGTFYAHYKDKDDFLLKIIKNEIRNYVAIICNRINHRRSIEMAEPTYEPALDLFDYIYENREIYKLIFSNTLHKQTFDYFWEKAWKEFLKNIDIELLQSDPSLNIDFYFYSHTYLYMSFIKYWIKNDFKFSPQYMMEQSQKILYNKTNKVMSKAKKR